MNAKRYYCPVEATVDVIGGKWKSRILWHLSHSTYRYGDFMRLIPEISKKMLSQALRELERDGLIMRQEFPEKILRVEYSLTEYGKSLAPLLAAMSKWGKNHMEMLSDPEETRISL
ncbi:winged helix-turn-helix transcriptional regulator [Bacillus sp. FJAT-27245]|uniref:winged helix-turn-helix transcriptional regulator n=1 Tax=Bacillus sp. FJAT-27245 TaxID=1684144 RepID=UPI0006A7E166|nr:helix-turn-helix domain-containing protein [Bacillus sp. FJAT-27245]